MPTRRRAEFEGDSLFYFVHFFFLGLKPPPKKKVSSRAKIRKGGKKLRAVVLTVLNMRICYSAKANSKRGKQKIQNKRILISFFSFLFSAIKQTLLVMIALCQ